MDRLKDGISQRDLKLRGMEKQEKTKEKLQSKQNTLHNYEAQASMNCKYLGGTQ